MILLLNRSAGRSLPVPTQQISSSSESAAESVLLCVCLLSMMALSSSSSSSSDELMNEWMNEWMNEQGEHKIRSTVWPRYRYGWNTVRHQRPLSSSLALASRLFVIVYLCTSIHELFIILIKLNPSSSTSSKPFSLSCIYEDDLFWVIKKRTDFEERSREKKSENRNWNALARLLLLHLLPLLLLA